MVAGKLLDKMFRLGCLGATGQAHRLHIKVGNFSRPKTDLPGDDDETLKSGQIKVTRAFVDLDQATSRTFSVAIDATLTISSSSSILILSMLFSSDTCWFSFFVCTISRWFDTPPADSARDQPHSKTLSYPHYYILAHSGLAKYCNPRCILGKIDTIIGYLLTHNVSMIIRSIWCPV